MKKYTSRKNYVTFKTHSQEQWLRPVILDTQETESGMKAV
jgi:hypothetical protein